MNELFAYRVGNLVVSNMVKHDYLEYRGMILKHVFGVFWWRLG